MTFVVFVRLSTMADGTEVSEQVFKLEGVIYYVDPQSFGSVGFLGGKERVRIPINSTHSSLEALKRHIIQYAGLKAESEKRGLGSSIELKLCRVEKSVEGSKAYAINTQAQWQEERNLFFSSTSTAVLQGENNMSLIVLIAKLSFFLHVFMNENGKSCQRRSKLCKDPH